MILQRYFAKIEIKKIFNVKNNANKDITCTFDHLISARDDCFRVNQKECDNLLYNPQ